MKIAKADTHLVRLPYTTGGDGNIGNMDWSTLDYVLVRIEVESGLVGWGDAFAYGGAARSVKAVVDYMLAPQLIGKDASAIGQLSYYLQQGNHLVGPNGQGNRPADFDLVRRIAAQRNSCLCVIIQLRQPRPSGRKLSTCPG